MLDDEFRDADSVESEPVIIGFQTSQGSMYRYNPDVKASQRFKVSFGTGQGETDPKCICVFLTETQRDHVQKNFHYQDSRWSYRFGWQKGNEHDLFYGNEAKISDGAEIALHIYDKKDNKYAFSALITTDGPDIGLTPLEKGYYNDPETNERMGSSHLGNKIVKLYTNVDQFEADLAAAKSNLGLEGLDRN